VVRKSRKGIHTKTAPTRLSHGITYFPSTPLPYRRPLLSEKKWWMVLKRTWNVLVWADEQARKKRTGLLRFTWKDDRYTGVCMQCLCSVLLFCRCSFVDKLACGSHKCEEPCHRGKCPPCWQVSFDELRCECGTEVIYPPVPCGTTPPLCNRPCTRPHSCGHTVCPSHWLFYQFLGRLQRVDLIIWVRCPSVVRTTVCPQKGFPIPMKFGL